MSVSAAVYADCDVHVDRAGAVVTVAAVVIAVFSVIAATAVGLVVITMAIVLAIFGATLHWWCSLLHSFCQC